MGGRALIPGKTKNECISEYSKKDCCKEWYYYQDILEQLVNIY